MLKAAQFHGYFLVFTGEAMFQIKEKYGGIGPLMEQIERDTREGFLAACSAAAIMAEQGELVRRRLGYDPGEIPEADDFSLLVLPHEIVGLKNAVINAVALGFGREVKGSDSEEYDEGLAELNQKKTPFGGRTTTA